MTSYRNTEIASMCSLTTNDVENTLCDSTESIASSFETQDDVFVMRHGERLDQVFKDWITKCFNEKGEYDRIDLNMPSSLPDRNNMPNSYKYDPPLTNVGLLQAKLTGEAFSLLDNIALKYVYSSPALRCVQTCHSFLTGLGICNEISIRIEPSFFERLWSEAPFPEFMTDDELLAAGYNIDVTYKPMITRDELKNRPEENVDEYYSRNYEAVKRTLEIADEEGPGYIFLVIHAASIDACTRQLTGFAPREEKKIWGIIEKIPHCSVVHVQKQGIKWKLHPSPVHCMSHLKNETFDYTILTNK